jgi:long-chain acyl-CoA synthetase
MKILGSMERVTMESLTPDVAALRDRARVVRGILPDEYQVSYLGIADLLAQRTEASPEKSFLIHYEADGSRSEWSYAGFQARVSRIAARLSDDLGLARGDRIATLAYNHADTVFIYFAAWTLGLAVVPLNTSEDDDRLAFILDNAEARVLFARPEYLERARALLPRAPGVQELVPLTEEALLADERPTTNDQQGGPDVGRSSWVVRPNAVDHREDEALLVYTSGTTGPPKGVVLTQYNLLVDAWGIAEWQGIAPDHRMMCVLPIHHVNGIVVTLATPLYAGTSLVLERQFRSSTFWEHVGAEKVQIVSVVPTLLHYLCESEREPDAPTRARFRHFICGAGTLSVALAARFEERFGLPILHGYGLSETTCYSCFLPVDLAQPERRTWLCDHGYPSIGVPIAPNEMTIMDPEGRTLGEGERGEIVIRGHNVMKGYYRRPDANASAFAHGWFHSGDEGFYQSDAQGRPFFFITGRLKELINRGGVKFSPFDIEEVLAQAPGVGVALVVAFDNAAYGEEVGAYVVPEPGATPSEAEVIAFCRARMPFAKCPKVVVFGQEVPVTTTGKYQRLKLKPLFAAWQETQFRE